MFFPYGKAPLAILVLALLSGAAVLLMGRATDGRRADLVFVTFTKEHAAAYGPVIAEFERERGVRVQVQVVALPAIQGRLQSSMQVGAEVPDMVELLDGTLGIFTRGPAEDCGFVDLTQRVRDAQLTERLVSSRFGKWTSRGHIFALPHDVHPVMLAYRRDLVEQLGIDVSKLTTWAEFERVGRDIVTKDLDGDGVSDRYMIDLPADGGDALRLLLLQRGGNLFNTDGSVAIDSPAAAEVMATYLRWTSGKDRIAFPCGSGQTLSKAINDGLALFYVCPDWRIAQFMTDVPNLSGKLALIPLPAWEPDGRRTSTWGGTGMAITKACERPELAWDLAMKLYYEPQTLGKRYAATHILPPLKAAWTEPQFAEPLPFFSNQAVGSAYVALADSVPEEQSSVYSRLAVDQLNEAFGNARVYFENNGTAGLDAHIRAALTKSAERVRVIMQRNVFEGEGPSQSGGKS